MNTIFTRAKMNSVMGNREFTDVLYNLACRWNVEKGCEDIKSYIPAVEAGLAKVLGTEEFSGKVKMTKRPFGFVVNGSYEFMCKDGSKHVNDAQVSMYAKMSGEIGWNVVPVRK